MKKIFRLLNCCQLTALILLVAYSVDGSDKKEVSIDNPMTEQYLQKNLRKTLPRLILNSDIEKDLRQKLESDPVIGNFYKAIKINAAGIHKKPLLKREKIGRRLLHVSREMLYRMNMLGMAYRIEKDPEILQRINDELIAVCNFSDWNPSHFLDTAEMSMAVAFALDWTAGDLPKKTIEMAQNALIEKGINPSWQGKMSWIKGNNNWNQVCHGGMIAAAIAIAEKDPELAAKTIKRSLAGIPNALAEYAPDGVYPEGATYWGYGTSFTILTISMLRSAFGNDFKIDNAPGFRESAVFKVLACSPSGYYFNYGDCSDKKGSKGDTTLAWFAAETGNKSFFEKELFLKSPRKMGKLGRNDGAALVWMSQFQEKEEVKAPAAWKGGGANPIIIFTGGDEDTHQYYFGGKGGRGTVNHGNMDAGSFVFELDGVRWVVDPGNQGYHELEKEGFNLWGKKQDSERWQLLTKNNFGHSTISVNDQLHKVDGMAEIVDFKSGSKPEAVIDLTPVFKGQLKKAQRKFSKDSPISLTIEDDFVLAENTKLITWQLMTTADVEIIDGGVILRKDGKQIKLENLSHPQIPIIVVPLDPPPHKLDRKIKDLKRLELRVPRESCQGGKTKIKVRIGGE